MHILLAAEQHCFVFHIHSPRARQDLSHHRSRRRRHHSSEPRCWSLVCFWFRMTKVTINKLRHHSSRYLRWSRLLLVERWTTIDDHLYPKVRRGIWEIGFKLAPTTDSCSSVDLSSQSQTIIITNTKIKSPPTGGHRHHEWTVVAGNAGWNVSPKEVLPACSMSSQVLILLLWFLS